MLKDAAAAIVGIAEKRFAKKLEPSEKSLAIEAILAALGDVFSPPVLALGAGSK